MCILANNFCFYHEKFYKLNGLNNRNLFWIFSLKLGCPQGHVLWRLWQDPLCPSSFWWFPAMPCISCCRHLLPPLPPQLCPHRITWCSHLVCLSLLPFWLYLCCQFAVLCWESNPWPRMGWASVLRVLYHQLPSLLKRSCYVGLGPPLELHFN